MQRNEATIDRIIRGAIAVIAAVAAFVVTEPGTVLGVGLLAVAVIMAGTAITGFCPLYRLLGISTCRVRSRA